MMENKSEEVILDNLEQLQQIVIDVVEKIKTTYSQLSYIDYRGDFKTEFIFLGEKIEAFNIKLYPGSICVSNFDPYPLGKLEYVPFIIGKVFDKKRLEHALLYFMDIVKKRRPLTSKEVFYNPLEEKERELIREEEKYKRFDDFHTLQFAFIEVGEYDPNTNSFPCLTKKKRIGDITDIATRIEMRKQRLSHFKQYKYRS